MRTRYADVHAEPPRTPSDDDLYVTHTIADLCGKYNRLNGVYSLVNGASEEKFDVRNENEQPNRFTRPFKASFPS